MKNRLAFLFGAGVALLRAGVAGAADDSRRLFDFSPISATNPVVASIDHSIAIPLSELRGYQMAERLRALPDQSNLGQKRALLNDLIDEYLLIHEAYRTSVPQSTGFTKQMEGTRTLILTDFMATRALAAAKSANVHAVPAAVGGEPPVPDAATALADRLFDATPIDISNEAFAILKRSAHAIDAAREASQRGPIIDSAEEAAAKVRAIVHSTPDATVVRYEQRAITIRQLLSLYAASPAPRADVQTEKGFVAFIKPLITPELLAAEAVRQGVEQDPLFRQKVIQNQNTLLRFHMQGAIEHAVGDILNAPDHEARLRRWYDQHRQDYRTPDNGGGTRPATYEEARPRAEADYSVALMEQVKAEKVAALRRAYQVEIYDDALRAP